MVLLNNQLKYCIEIELFCSFAKKKSLPIAPVELVVVEGVVVVITPMADSQREPVKLTGQSQIATLLTRRHVPPF